MRVERSGPPFELKARVYFEDTDAGGIVYYVNYLKFMERARTELVRTLGFDQSALQRENVIFVVHSVTARYHAPAGDLLCEGGVLVACVSADQYRPRAIPDNLRDAFRSSGPGRDE